MKRFFSLWRESAAKLRDVRVLTAGALLVALYAVTYSPVAGNVVIVPNLMELRFGFLVVALSGMLYGPVMGILVGLLGDLIGSTLFYGGSFLFGYTISWMVMGAMFGCFLFGHRPTLPRILLTNAVVMVVINQFLTTFWQSVMFSGAYWPRFVARLPQNLILYPINTFLLIVVLRGMESVLHRARRSA